MTDSDIVILEAIYREISDPEYKGNPLIEALPEVLSSDALQPILTQRPTFTENERQLPEHFRRHAIARLLYDFFEPFDRHYELEESISDLIRKGYVGRNPAGSDLKKHILNGYERVQKGELEAFLFDDVRSTARSTCLIGCSGIGKTWALNRILATYPQVIFHPEYQLYQVVRLKLDCPKDGSLKALCMQFFIGLDKLLHTQYFRRHCRSRASVDDLLILMAEKANEHCLGILVIDEIQHLDRAKSGGAATMLNFFVTLVNTIGVPVVLVGTHKASDILQEDFRQARRACGHVWDRLEQNSEDWDDLIEAIWPYQWTVQKTQLTESLKNHLFDLTQGVVDITVKLFVLAQHRAISLGGNEQLEKGLFDQVMADSFEMVKPMLQALRSNDAALIAKYGDLCAPSILEKLLAAQKSARKQKRKPEKTVMTSVASEQVEHLASMLNVGKDIVELVLEELLSADPELEKNNLLLLKKAFEVITQSVTSVPSKQVAGKTKRQKQYAEGDLRLLHKQASDQDASVYHLLQEANYIKGIEEFDVA